VDEEEKRKRMGKQKEHEIRTCHDLNASRVPFHCIAIYHAPIISQLPFEKAGSRGLVAGRG
jgi:hypothetical protein